jgi:Mrp family chromosome partitioning ATPase
MRLTWPSPSPSQPCDPPDTEATSTATAHATTHNDKGIDDKVRKARIDPRRVTFDQNKTSILWADKHTPGNSADLAIAPAKVKAVSEWMQAPSSKLLVLVGKPGIGKSTMVRVLARELALELMEWN